MTVQRKTGSATRGTPTTRENPPVGQEISAPAADGNRNGKTREALSNGQESSAPASGADRGRLTKIRQTVGRAPIWAWVISAVVVFVVSLPLLALAGLLGGESADGDGGNAAKTAKTANAVKPVEGSFVGKVSGKEAFVAVLAAPAEAGQNERAVKIYVTDGNRVSESFSGSISKNSFTAESEDGDSEAKGELSGDLVKGTLELPNGKTVRFKADRPAGAAGLYDLTVSAKGKLKGASVGGIGVKGRVELLEGSGVLRLADGRHLRFDVSEDPDDLQVRAGQVLLIVLASGEVRGAGMSPAESDEDASAFFIRSRS